MEINFMGYTFFLGRKKEAVPSMEDRARNARSERSLRIIKRLKKELELMYDEGVKYSDYRLQKRTGISINTIKKYRGYFRKWQEEIQTKKGLF